MTNRRWRRVEIELEAALDAAGLDLKRQDGDLLVVIASLDCQTPRACRAVIGPYGKVECADCENAQNLNGCILTLDLTQLARRLADIT